MTVLKTRRVIKSDIGAAFIKVLGAIKWRKNLYRNLLYLPSTACSMQHERKKNTALSEQQGRHRIISASRVL